MSSMEGNSAFERRSREARGRIRKPSESDDVIQLPDLNNIQQNASREVNQEKQSSSEGKRYITLMPDEIPDATETHYVVDDQTDPTAAGVVNYKGRLLRPLTEEERNEISELANNPKLNKIKGPKRLSSLDEPTETASDTPQSTSAEEAGTKAVEEALQNELPTNPGNEAPAQPETPLRRMRAVMRGGDFFVIEDGKERRANTGEEESLASQWLAQKEGREVKPGQDGILYDLTIEPASGTTRTGSPGDESPQGPPPSESEYAQSPHQYEREAIQGMPFTVDKSKYLGLDIPTIDQIQGDKQKQQLFGELLSALRPDKVDLMGRMATTGKMDDEEREIIYYAQHEFARRLKEAEQTAEYITPELIREMARRDKGLDMKMTERGPALLAQVFKERIPHLAMRHEIGFEEFAHHLHNVKENRETRRFKRYQRDIEDLCSFARIKPHEYDDYFSSGDAREKIRENMRSDMSNGRKTIDNVFSKIGLGSAGRARHAEMQAKILNAQNDPRWFSPQSWVLDEVNKSLNAVAAYAGYTLADAESNPEIVEALTRGAFTGEGVKTSEETGPQTREEVHAIMSEDAVKSRLDTFKKSYRADESGHDWTHLTDDERSSAYQTFQSQELRADSKGRGMWAMILMFLKATLLSQRVNAIEKKPVLAYA